MLTVLFLTGCAAAGESMDRAMALRSKLLAQGVSFDTDITANYGDMSVNFTLFCKAEKDGTLTFEVKKPETLAGITGTVSPEGGKFTFDRQAIAFELLADGQVSPISAPWLLMNTLRSGYLTSCGTEGEHVRLAIDDSYQENALHLDIWLTAEDTPVRGEILWQGRRILSMEVRNFCFL